VIPVRPDINAGIAYCGLIKVSYCSMTSLPSNMTIATSMIRFLLANPPVVSISTIAYGIELAIY
jgi:hypothetical protein